MTTGKRIGYIRVSTTDQNPERQLEGIPLDKRFVDYASGSTMNRPQLEMLIEYAREDDLIIVHSMDRLARNVKDLRQIIDLFISKGVKIQFLKESLIFSDDKNAMSNLLLMVIGSIAEFEHSLIKERQAEGIKLAMRAGKYRGRKRKMTEEKITTLNQELLIPRNSITEIAKKLQVSRYTIYRYLNQLPKTTTLEGHPCKVQL